jgi:hypothetical protein
MKNSKRILIAVVAVVLLCATFVTGALALVAGENTTPEQYMSSVVTIQDDFNDGQVESSRDGLEIAGSTNYNPGYMFNGNPPKDYVDHQGDAARIEDGTDYGRNGADDVYTKADESQDEHNLYYNFNYYKKGQATHFFLTMMLAALNDSSNITKGGYVFECDINFWHPITSTQTAGQNTPDDLSDDEYEYTQNADGWVCPSIQWEIMNTTSGSHGSIPLIGFVQAKERDANGNVIKNGTAEVAKKGYVEVFSNATGNYVQFPANVWKHITIQYDYNGLYRVYIGRDSDPEGRILLVEQRNVNNGITVYMASFRIGGAAGVLQGEYALDNILAYQATTIHDPNLFTNMESDSEIVKYLCDLLYDENSTATVKNSAYDMITKSYLTKFWNGTDFLGSADEQARAAINAYFDFKESGKYDQMLIDLRQENTDAFVKYVNELRGMARTLASITDRNTKLATIEGFVASVGAAIDRSTEDYKAASVLLGTIRAEIKRDENSQELIKQMDAFQKSYSIYAVNAMAKRFELATAAYMNYTEDGIFQGNDATKLAAAIQSYKDAQLIIAQVLKDVNSDRFVNLVGLYKDTNEEDWANDDGTIRRYWYLSRSILLAKDKNGEPDYTPDYKGMNEAMAIYNRVYDYFWAVMQQEHIDVISEKLSKFNNPNATYIEQAGVCTFINNYIERNKADIDPNNAQINELIKISRGYETILNTIEDDYQKSLAQNTEKFVHTMSLLSATNGYVNMMPLYEEATVLYYSMNIETDEAKAAAAAYEQIRAKLTAIATDSTLFVAKVNELAAEKDANKAFVILSECYASSENIDETYEGVTAAKTIYDAKMAEHQAAVIANAEIAETVEVSCSVRALDKALEVIKFVKNCLGI